MILQDMSNLHVFIEYVIFCVIEDGFFLIIT